MTTDGRLPTRRSLRRGDAGSDASVVDDPAMIREPQPVLAGGVDPAATPLLVAAAALSDDGAPMGASAAATAVADVPPSVPVVIPPTALAWVQEDDVARRGPLLELGTGPAFVPVTSDLLARAPRRSPWRPGVLIPFGFIAALIVAYCATVLLWPLYAVTPTVTALTAQPIPAPAAQPAWPGAGSAAVSVDGIGTSIASSGDAVPMASVTKVVTALVVLEQMPLAPGEQGRTFQFGSADRATYWNYRARGESSLDVPVGGSLTEYQMLQGMLIASAGNYADRLAATIWPTDALYASAANTWLSQHGIGGITVVEPTGIDPANTATPEALLALGARAMANPVIAEIVRTPSVELPGAGLVQNTNPLLADPGVVGIKTGTLDTWNLLAAKDIAVGEVTVRVYADMMGQPDPDTRDAALRALFDRTAAELQPAPSVTAGTTVGQVETLWGDPVSIVTASDASVILWNGTVADVDTTFDLGDARDAGDTVGTLTATGPKNAQTVDLTLKTDVEGPSAWWRLTHPLELFGLL